jgi:hypothetical protein
LAAGSLALCLDVDCDSGFEGYGEVMINPKQAETLDR